jgi:hypothetical protein
MADFEQLNPQDQQDETTDTTAGNFQVSSVKSEPVDLSKSKSLPQLDLSKSKPLPQLDLSKSKPLSDAEELPKLDLSKSQPLITNDLEGLIRLNKFQKQLEAAGDPRAEEVRQQAIALGQTLLHPDKDRSALGKAWDWLNRGIISKETMVRLISGMTPEQLDEALSSYQDETPTHAAIREFVRGSIQDIGQLGSSFTSPASLALVGGGVLAKSISRFPGLANRILGATRALQVAKTAKAVQDVGATVFGAEGLRSMIESGVGLEDLRNALQLQGDPEKWSQFLQGASMAAVGVASGGEIGKAGVRLLTPDTKLLESAVKLHDSTQKIFDQRMQEVDIATKQAEQLAAEAERLRQAEQAGLATRQQVADAETAASKAAANARVAQEALKQAGASRAEASMEVNRLQRKVAKAQAAKAQKEAQAKAVAAATAKESFQKAIPPASSGPASYTPEDYEIARGYLERHHKNIQEIDSIEDVRDALQAAQHEIEEKINPYIEKYADEPITTNVKLDVHNKLSESPNLKFYDRGMKLFDEYDMTDLTVSEAEKIRNDLNALNRAVLKRNFWDVATALKADPEFAARYAAAESLRDGIYGALEEKQIEGVREARQDEAAIIRVKNAADKQIAKSEMKIRGTSDVGVVRRTAAKGVETASKVGGAVIGTTVGHPVVGYEVGKQVGTKLGQIIAPTDLTRNQLVAQSMELETGGRLPKEITGTGLPPVRPEFELPPGLREAYTPPQREFTDLHNELATHYGEPVTQSTYRELEQRFLEDIGDKQQHGVPLEDSEKTLLGKINQQIAADALDLQKQLEEYQKKQQTSKIIREASIPDEVEGLLQVPAEKLGQGMTTEAGIIHDLAHIIVGTKRGLKFSDGIRSHLHPENQQTGNLMSAPIDWSDFIDADGNFDFNKMKDRAADFITTYVAGGVANDLYHDIPFTENQNLGADLKILQTFLKRAGFTDVEISRMIAQAADDAAEILSQPDVRTILEGHAAVREAGLDEKYHISPERVQQILNDIEGVEGEKYDITREPTGTIRESGRTSGELGIRPEAGVEAENIKVVPTKSEGATKRTTESTEPPTPKLTETEPSSPKLAEAAEKKSTSEKLIEKYGTTDEPLRAAFIFTDGRMVPLQGEHDVMINTAEGQVGGFGKPRRQDFINEENAIRVHYYPSGIAGEGPTVSFSVPKKVTLDQIDQMKQAVGELGRYGNAQIENVSTKDGKFVKKEFVRPSDIDKMVADVGAHPEVLGSPKLSPAVPKERTTGNTDRDEAIRRGGGIPGGVMKSDPKIGLPELTLFHDPQTGTTLALKSETVTPELVRQKIIESRGQYAGEDIKKASVAEAANTYNKIRGKPPIDATPKLHNPEFAKKLADAFDKAEHNPNDPAVKKSYDALKKGIDEQWDYATKQMGMKFEPWTKEGQPYANSKEMIADVKNNKHLYFFQGGELLPGHPLAEIDPKTGLSYNDKFRAVHDLFGHAAHEFQFGPKGEENAYLVHRQMFDPEAIPSLTSETRAQNSWVNFGKHLRNAEGEIPQQGEPGYIPPSKRPYAEQKATILPEEFHSTGHVKPDIVARIKKESSGAVNPRTGQTDTTGVGVEIYPEARRVFDTHPTAQDIEQFIQDNKELFDKHPELRVGWDRYGKELNIGAAGTREGAIQVAKKLDQRSAFDIDKSEEIPTGGQGKQTVFENYPLEQRLAELKGEKPPESPKLAAKEEGEKPRIAPLEIPLEKRPRSHDTTMVLRHEWGHIINAYLEGFQPKEIFSHLHPDLKQAPHVSAASLIDYGDFIDPRGFASFKAVNEHLDNFLTTFMGGAAVDELFNKIPLNQNYSLGGDVSNAIDLLQKLGYTKTAGVARIYAAVERGKMNLTQHPEIATILEEAATGRHPDTPETHHARPEDVQEVLQKIDEVIKHGKKNRGDEIRPDEVVSTGGGENVPGTEGKSTEAIGRETSTVAPESPKLAAKSRSGTEEESQPRVLKTTPGAPRDIPAWPIEDVKGKALLDTDGELVGHGREHEDFFEQRLAEEGKLSEDELKDTASEQLNDAIMKGVVRLGGVGSSGPVFVHMGKEPTASQRATIGRLIKQQGGGVWDIELGKELGDRRISGEATTPGDFWRQVDMVFQSKPENPKLSPKGSSVPLMESPLSVTGTGKRGRITTLDVARELNKYMREKVGKLELTEKNEPRMIERASKLAEDEAKYQLAQNNTGEKWYTDDIAAHDKILSDLRPELKDPNKLSLFKMVEAITSSGQKPYQNLKTSLKLWDNYNKTGEFPPVNPETGRSWGPRNPASYARAIDSLNKLIAEKGESEAVKWLLSDHPISELRKYMTEEQTPIRGKATDMETGALIFGSKRGPFALNLHGRDAEFTADRWVTRSWNRWMGTLDEDALAAEEAGKGEHPRNLREYELMKQAFEKVAQKLNKPLSAVQAILWYYEQGLYTRHGVPKESWSFADAASRIQQESRQRPLKFEEFINLLKQAPKPISPRQEKQPELASP